MWCLQIRKMSESDSETRGVLDSAANRTMIALYENENRTSDSVEGAGAQELDSRHQLSPATVDADSRPVTADCELVESGNTSSNCNIKGSSVDESHLLVVDKLSLSQPPDLPLPVVDISTEMSSLQPADCDAVGEELLSEIVPLSREQHSSDICQSQASEAGVLEQRDSSGASMESSLVIISSQDNEVAAETDRPSTVIVISAHRNKDVSATSCQPDLDCASADVTENNVCLSSEVDKVPRSMADLYMCCSDDEVSVTDSASDPPTDDRQNANVDSLLSESQNDNESVSDDAPATKCVVMPKQQTTGYGMAGFAVWLYFCAVG